MNKNNKIKKILQRDIKYSYEELAKVMIEYINDYKDDGGKYEQKENNI